MATAFVTGGTGFVGRHLINLLRAEGWNVIALHRRRSRIESLQQFGVRLVEGSILEADALVQAIPEGIDAVFHVAGSTNMWSPRNLEQKHANVDGTRNMVAAALKRRVKRFIHTSSIVAYGFHVEPITEATPSNAADSWINYMRTKRLAELEVYAGIQRGLDAVLINPANIVGSYDYRNWSQLIRLLVRGKLYGLPPGRASFCSVKAVAQAHLAAFYRGETAEHYLLGGADADYVEVARRVGSLLDCRVPQKILPLWILRVTGRISLWVSLMTRKEPAITPEKVALASRMFICRSGKAQQRLDYRPVGLEEMLSECIQWMRAAHRI